MERKRMKLNELQGKTKRTDSLLWFIGLPSEREERSMTPPRLRKEDLGVTTEYILQFTVLFAAPVWSHENCEFWTAARREARTI